MSNTPLSSHSSERTPLLSRQDDESASSPVHEANGTASTAADAIHSQESGKRRWRWPSIIALSVLSLVVVIASLGFTIPAVVEKYAQEALVFEPDQISIDSFTSIGVRARIKGTFYLDASRIHKKSVRDLGRAATWIAKEVESGDSTLQVYLPEYDSLLLGTAKVPPIKVNVRNRHYNHLDFVTDLEPGNVDGIRRITKDFLDGSLSKLSVEAVAKVPLKSGLIKLGNQKITQALAFEGKDLPTVPSFNIEKLRFAEYGQPGHPDGMRAMAQISILNDYPVSFDVPPLTFKVLLPDCFGNYLGLGTAKTDLIHIVPKQYVNASVTGLIHQLPTSLTTACPKSDKSPLDRILGDYLAGRDATVFVKGGDQDENTPDWIGKILEDITVPFSLPGHSFDNLIKNFSLANVHFSLPDPLSEDSRPKVSAVVKALVGLPPEMNVNLNVNRVRADADVFYKGDRLGKLDLEKWQPANVTKVGDDLLIMSVVDQAPLEVTNDDVFSKVIQELVFGGKGVRLGIEARVDVNTFTALGEFVVRNIPAKGKIFVKPIAGRFEQPEISNIKIVNGSPETLVLQAKVNITNPTEYSAHVPHVNVSLLVNETRVGYVWASADVVPGVNDITVTGSWDVGPVSREWLSHLISGHNTSLTFKTHANSIPSLPDVGLNITIPTPKLFSKFLKEATMHLISSSATFVLVSPVALYVTYISAVASYNNTEVGTIEWEYPFAVDEGETTTPRLPVDWGLDAIGTVRDALGGTLKLDAKADVGVRIGGWKEHIWYEGSGIGAKIRL